jgi:hypothetical protein
MPFLTLPYPLMRILFLPIFDRNFGSRFVQMCESQKTRRNKKLNRRENERWTNREEDLKEIHDKYRQRIRLYLGRLVEKMA